MYENSFDYFHDHVTIPMYENISDLLTGRILGLISLDCEQIPACTQNLSKSHHGEYFLTIF